MAKLLFIWDFIRNIENAIFLDLPKAFNTVNHNILLEKLKKYGIRSENLKWFRSYLSNRKQFILYDDFKTEVKIVKCGVLQGSILGAFAFSYFHKRPQQLD